MTSSVQAAVELPTGSERIDREALVRRHSVVLTEPDAQNPLTVGNGEFAYTADITGMQTFRDFHDPDVAERDGRLAVDTCTMTTWGWHAMPNPDGYELGDAMSTYETPRGTVSYPDKLDLDTILGRRPVTDETRPAMWLHVNPQRIDLGRVGLRLRPAPGAPAETDPAVLSDVRQELDLWTGLLTSRFTYRGEQVQVTTVSDPETATVAFTIESALLITGHLSVGFAFPYASDAFGNASDWNAARRHHTAVGASGRDGARFTRTLDDTTYVIRAHWNEGELLATDAPDDHHHDHELTTTAAVLTLVVGFEDAESDAPGGAVTVAATTERSAQSWRSFWEDGAALDLGGNDDPRAQELERRVVLSQYLTAVNCSGSQPPQETGLVTNSWQGKFHLEMHWWHAAHFALWGRPGLLAKSIGWYESILDSARKTATRQGYSGARWPKQVGPDGRESPTDIGSFLVWQQPHVIFFAELLRRAGSASDLLDRLQVLVDETATFMASFLERRPDGYHLAAPIMPAQEFYDPLATEDPTYELAYWWWALDVAQQWRERNGSTRRADWDDRLAGLTKPLVRDGRYAAVATEPFTRVDDHPSMLAAFGFIPSTPLVDPDVAAATREWVLDAWDWDTAWGWDFPVVAMNAARTGNAEAAVTALLLPVAKNHFLANGHNPQAGNFLPIYLPGNGGLLAAVAMMAGGWEGSERQAPGFPDGWVVRAEGFVPAP